MKQRTILSTLLLCALLLAGCGAAAQTPDATPTPAPEAAATPTPTLPLTSMITSCTTAGRIAAVMAKLCVQRERYIATPAVASPSTRDTAVQIRKPESVSVEPRMELSTV